MAYLLRRKFSLFKNMFGHESADNLSQQVGKVPNTVDLPNHTPILRGNQPSSVQITKLSNGISILTETTPFPTSVHMGVLIGGGTRDETPRNNYDYSGVCMALKENYLKSHLRSNEKENYNTVQKIGAEMSMMYDQERILYYGQCLSQNAESLLQVISDCALEEKTKEDEVDGRKRLAEYWKYKDETFTLLQAVDETWPTVAYGPRDLGLPLGGSKENFTNITVDHLNSFRKDVMQPDNILVYGGGVYNHDEFLELARPYFEGYSNTSTYQRPKSEYKGGEHRIEMPTDTSEMTYLHLTFQGVSWTDSEMPALNVLKTLVGDGGGFSTGGPGKGMHARAYTHILAKYPWIDSVKSINSVFTDNGNFGLLTIGLSQYCGYMMDGVTKELIDLTRVTDLEVSRAKNLFKAQIMITLEKTGTRIEELARCYQTFGKVVTLQDYIKLIDAITPGQIRKLAERVLKTKPTMVLIGGNLDQIPSVDKISSRFN